jgi:gamma-glutamyl-gamma-aminobutyrate hydrolase PuuD
MRRIFNIKSILFYGIIFTYTDDVDSKDFVKIGILSQPIDANTFRKAEGYEGFDQYVLDINRYFAQLGGKAKAVPLRYDLSKDKEKFAQTINELDGVLFTGGNLPLKAPKDANEASKVYYNTAKLVVEYAIETKLPVLAICMGF